MVNNRVEAAIEQPVVAFAIEQPAYGQHRVSNELGKKGIVVSGEGVRSIWLRQVLQTLNKRLKALSAQAAQQGLILTEEQRHALERARQETQSHGEIATEHPGYWGCQDSDYVGNLKKCWPHLSANLYRSLLQGRPG